MVELLLQLGADIDHKDNFGRTALHKAAYFGHKDVVVCLLQHGAAIVVVDLYEKTPSMVAREKNKKEVATIIDKELHRRMVEEDKAKGHRCNVCGVRFKPVLTKVNNSSQLFTICREWSV